MAFLRRALELGYGFQGTKDPDLAELHNLPEFQRLMASCSQEPAAAPAK
jgi:hypothetical protein